jgi:CelD/BcsL family acetyltransferase involved in cellulose biosynthesis
MLTLTAIRTEAELAGLELEWDGLFENARNQLPFLRFGWIRLCWERQRLQKGVSLFVLVLRDGGRVVLIAPFVRHRRLIFFHTVYFLDSLTPQYNDILVADDQKAPVYVACLVERLRARYDLVAFRMNWVRDDSLLLNAFRDTTFRNGRNLTALTIDLSRYGRWKDYLSARSRNLRRDHQRQVARQVTAGVAFRFLGPAEAAEGVAWLFSAKLRRMRLAAGSSAWIAQPETETLFANAAAGGVGRDQIWLTALVADEKPIAMCLAFNAGGALYFSKIAYDEEWKRYSPARTLILLTIEEAFARGLKRCDLMVGDAPYKNRIGDDHVQVVSRRVRLA